MKRLMLRGIRNHNPGNIEHGEAWIGLAEVQADSRFAAFKQPEFGIRAIGRILRTYQDRYGLRTVRGIISRWAPPHENPTERYIQFVADRVCGIQPCLANIKDSAVMQKFIEAIIRFENGIMPYSDALLARGVEMALH